MMHSTVPRSLSFSLTIFFINEISTKQSPLWWKCIKLNWRFLFKINIKRVRVVFFSIETWVKKKSNYFYKNISGKPVLGDTAWRHLVRGYWLISIPSSPPPGWCRDLFFLFIVFMTEKPSSHWHDVEKGRSASIAFFVMRQLEWDHNCWVVLQFLCSLSFFILAISSTLFCNS